MQLDSAIFGSYDIRGLYPQQLTPEVAYRVALAYAATYKPKVVAVGQDVREADTELRQALIRGLSESGVTVKDIGMVATDMLYFAVGHYGYDGGMTASASHNPPGYAGIKLTVKDAQPIFKGNGLMELRDMVLADTPPSPGLNGTVETQDIWSDYLTFITSFVDLSKITPKKIAANANFGMNGQILDRLIATTGLPLEIVKLNYEPDGTFPKGRPDPLRPENRAELLELTQQEQADFGVAWDGDGDRVFFCNNSGTFYEPCYLAAILIERFLKQHPGAKFLYDVRYVYPAQAAAAEHGGTALEVEVGHSFIKDRMRKEQALFCGESSGHYYFANNWYADNGMLPFLMMLEMLSATGQSITELLSPYTSRFFVSGEYNTKVPDAEAVMTKLKANYADGQLDTLDGISIAYADWRFNVRAAHTEPLLRLNVEAKNQQLMEQKRDELIALIQQS